LAGDVLMINGDFVAISMGKLGIGEMVTEIGVNGGIGNFVGGDGFGVGGGVVGVAVGGFILGGGAID